MSSSKNKVQLFLYDLSQGMAKLLSAQFLGKQIDGIWHTGIVVFGYEYYYGGGIQSAKPGCTIAGNPVQVIELGETEVKQEVFHEWLHSVSSRFTPETYSLLTHNCNNFTSECSKFLTGQDIPSFITGLPEEALNTPLGQMLRPAIVQMESQMKQQFSRVAVPWQEHSGSMLSLPPVRTDRSAAAAPSAPIPASLSSTPMSPPAQSVKPSEEKKVAEAGHLHSTLNLPAIVANSRPLRSSDKKAKSYETLLKTQSKKFGPEKTLSDSDRSVIANAVVAIENNTAFTPSEVTAITTLFDRLIRTWPVTAQFPVLGLFRLVVLKDEIVQHYFKAYQSKQGDVVEPLLQFIYCEKSENSTAVAPPSTLSEMPISTQLMALCSISNFFMLPEFGRLLALHDAVAKAALHVLNHKEQTLRALGAAVLYNMSVYLPKDDSESIVSLTSGLVSFVLTEQDEETCNRMLCALGQLVYCNDSVAALLFSLTFDSNEVAKRFPASARVKSIADDIAYILHTLDM